MAHRPIKKSLYEIIGEGKFKPFSSKSLEKKSKEIYSELEPPEEKPVKSPKVETQWPSRPKMLQFLNGRLETSVPYTLVIAFALACILLFLVFFRLGQLYEQKTRVPEIARTDLNLESFQGPQAKTEENIGKGSGVTYDAGKLQADSVQTETGSNHIVIMQYHNKKDLEPARKYFDENGIETEIEQRGDLYFLVTKKDTYNNPNKEGTDGFIAKQKIKEIGAGYEAPPGYEKFLFKDPYGEKVR
jgi:hypothetical protein